MTYSRQRGSGVYIPKRRARPTETDQNAGMPEDPQGYGLSQVLDETNDRTRVSDQTAAWPIP
jgi:hypothetical protein